MIYLDTSALVKLVVQEAETRQLAQWLNDHPDATLVTSVIGQVELIRATSRHSPAAATRARSLLETVDTVPMSPAIIRLAETIGPTTLRTLDALHLAAAFTIRTGLDAFCVYDERLAAAAAELALPCASPGVV